MERKLHTFGNDNFKFDAVAGSFEGYASTFNGVDSHNDTVIPGAYKDTLQNRQRPVAMFFNHISRRGDMPAKIGAYDSLEEDSHGLKVKGRLSIGHPTADAVLASMKSGTITGLSIGYRVPEGGSERKNGIRLLKKVDLFEVSIVEDPADLGAVINRDSIKSALDDMKTLADAEALLRDVAGFSAKAATAFASQLRSVILRDVGESDEKVAAVTDFLSTLKSSNMPILGLK